MTHQVKKMVRQLQIGDEGYCPVDAFYVAPSSPKGSGDSSGVGSTLPFLLPETHVYPQFSPSAKVRIRRMEEGYAIRLPSGEVLSRYRGQPVPGSLPIFAID